MGDLGASWRPASSTLRRKGGKLVLPGAKAGGIIVAFLRPLKRERGEGEEEWTSAGTRPSSRPRGGCISFNLGINKKGKKEGEEGGGGGGDTLRSWY